MKVVFKPTTISEVLKPITRTISIDPLKEYPLLGIRLDGGGVFLRERKLGSQIAASTLFQVKSGDFIYSRLFAWRGAFGIISDDLDGCYVSSEFPTFIPIQEKIETRFLQYWFRLPTTLSKVEADCAGSTPLTRNRFKENFFLALEIPLPSLEEQRRIVARIEELAARIEEARGLRREAVEGAEAIMQIARRVCIGETVSADWVPLGNHVMEIENGWSPACENRSATDEEWGVLKVGAVSFGVYHEFENKALPPILRPKTEYEVHPGDFLMSRANTTSLVGACALVEQTRSKLMLSDKIFRFHFKENAPLDRRYLVNVLKSPALRFQIELAASGTSPTMKNISKEKVLSLLVPTHSIDEQYRIIAYLDDLQSKVDSLKQLQSETSAELDALLPSILDKAFKGEL